MWNERISKFSIDQLLLPLNSLYRYVLRIRLEIFFCLYWLHFLPHYHQIYEECGVFKYDDCSRITFLTSHLKYVRLISFKGHEYEMEFVRFLLENGLVLEKLIIICEDTETIAEITEEVMRFTRSSSSIVVTILTTNCHSTWFSL